MLHDFIFKIKKKQYLSLQTKTQKNSQKLARSRGQKYRVLHGVFVAFNLDGERGFIGGFGRGTVGTGCARVQALGRPNNDRMLLHVRGQVTAVIKLFGADFALEGLHAGMYPLVDGEVAAVAELFGADAALVRLHSRVSAQVRGQISTVAEHFATDLAGVRSFPTVGAHVNRQVSAVGETFVALRALVRSLAVVRTHVDEQVALMAELLETNFAAAFQRLGAAVGALSRPTRTVMYN